MGQLYSEEANVEYALGPDEETINLLAKKGFAHVLRLWLPGFRNR
jgi:hypothetical protein